MNAPVADAANGLVWLPHVNDWPVRLSSSLQVVPSVDPDRVHETGWFCVVVEVSV